MTLSESDRATAKAIAKAAHVDRPETYRIIWSLEEQGFVQKILANPCKFQAVPLGVLVPLLLSKKRNELLDTEKDEVQLSQRKRNNNASLNLPDNQMIVVFHPQMIVVFHPQMIVVFHPQMIVKEINNKILCYKHSLDFLMTLASVRQTAQLWEKAIWAALERGVEITYMVEKPSQRNPLPDVLKRLNRHRNFSVRYLSNHVANPVIIADDREAMICISATENTNFLEVPYLFSTNPHLVSVAKEYFELFRRNSILCKKPKCIESSFVDVPNQFTFQRENVHTAG